MASKLMYGVPGGGQAFGMTALDDSGDNKTFDFGTIEYLSAWKKDDLDYSPDVLVDGVISGGLITPAASGTNDLVDVGVLTANIGGVFYRGSTALAADTDLSCTRGAGASTAYLINSIEHDGTSYSVVAGTGSTAFVLDGTRGGAGEPPYISVGSIEIGQIRFQSETSAVVTTDDIHQVKGDSVETYNFPGGKIEHARLENGVLGYAGYTFKAALPTIHTGDTTKKVYMSGYEETFAEWVAARNFVPQGVELTSTTESFYNGENRSSSDSSLTTGAFEWGYEDSVNDPEWDAMGGLTWFKFYQDTADTWYQAYLGRPQGLPTNLATGVNVSSVSLTGGNEYLRVKSS